MTFGLGYNDPTGGNQQLGGGGPSSPASPAGFGTGGGGYQAQSAFGRQFTPDGAGNAFDDPEAMIRQYFNMRGFNPQTGSLGSLMQQAPALGLIYTILNGADANRGNAYFLDWANKYLGQQLTPGAAAVTPADIMRGLYTDNRNSPVYQNLNNTQLTPRDQAGNWLSALKTGLSTSMPKPILNAMLARVDDLAQQFAARQMTTDGQGGSFRDYLQAAGVTPALFGG